MLPSRHLPARPTVFSPSQHHQALRRQQYVVQYDKGAGLLPSGIGCGRTTPTRAFILQSGENKHHLHLGTSACGCELDLRHALNAHLVGNLERCRIAVPIQGEGSGVAGPAGCEELRMRPSFRLADRVPSVPVLVGQPELQDRIAPILGSSSGSPRAAAWPGGRTGSPWAGRAEPSSASLI